MCVCVCVCVCVSFAASTGARDHLKEAALGQSVSSALSEDEPPNAVAIHTSKVWGSACAV